MIRGWLILRGLIVGLGWLTAGSLAVADPHAPVRCVVLGVQAGLTLWAGWATAAEWRRSRRPWRSRRVRHLWVIGRDGVSHDAGASRR